jgi:hypothetical protein
MGQGAVEVRKSRVVTETDKLEVDAGVGEEVQLLDVLRHGLGFLGNEGLHELWGADRHSDADQAVSAPATRAVLFSNVDCE